MWRRSSELIFWSMMVLTIVDRGMLLGVFAFNYVGTDDAVIWSAALDYGHGCFREPYFYGQDYGPMLEALLAAPFTHLGIPLHILLPLVTALLAMAPYWSFALWHRRHQRPAAACLFLAIPLLLPAEFGLMTSVTRGFVTGIGLLAFLPWILDTPNASLRWFLLGAALSLACFVNPNALPFAVAFFAGQLLAAPPSRALLLCGLGTVPAIIAQILAQAYWSAHPERLMNVLFDWRMDFHAAGIAEAFSRLDHHFAWLSPVFWPYGQIIGEALVLVLIVHAWKRNRAMAVALFAAMAVVVLSFGFAKVHQANHNVFYGYSRMFLALPLLLGWAIAALGDFRSTRLSWGLLMASFVALTMKSVWLQDAIQEQLAGIDQVVSEGRLDDLRADAAELGDLCEDHQAGLVLLLPERTEVAAQFRSMLHPLLDDRIPVSYLVEQDHRYWVREALGDSIVRNVLIVGSAEGPLGSTDRLSGRVLDIMGSRGDRFVLIVDNALPTDSLFLHVLGRAKPSGDADR